MSFYLRNLRIVIETAGKQSRESASLWIRRSSSFNCLNCLQCRIDSRKEVHQTGTIVILLPAGHREIRFHSRNTRKCSYQLIKKYRRPGNLSDVTLHTKNFMSSAELSTALVKIGFSRYPLGVIVRHTVDFKLREPALKKLAMRVYMSRKGWISNSAR